MATVRADWKFPEPPEEGSVATYFNDGYEIWLHWVDPMTGEPVADCDIEWPFALDEVALHTELEALGFRNVEELDFEAA